MRQVCKDEMAREKAYIESDYQAQRPRKPHASGVLEDEEERGRDDKNDWLLGILSMGLKLFSVCTYNDGIVGAVFKGKNVYQNSKSQYRR